jgi:hypothetical protein
MQADDFHAEFAPMANNRESVHDLNDNVPVVEIMATNRTKMATISSAASTSAATRVKKASITSDSDSDSDAYEPEYLKTVKKPVKKRKRVVDSSDEVREVE